MPTLFSEMLAKFRRRARISQRALAMDADIDTSYISKLEKGERDVTSRDLALKFARVLHLSADETDLWLLSAGYASPRLQQLAGSDISRLLDQIDNDLDDSSSDN